MKHPLRTLGALVLAGGMALATATADQPATVNGQTLPEWIEWILPRAEDNEWQGIPWRTAFWESVEEAQAEGKPILLWAMNGHPMACT